MVVGSNPSAATTLFTHPHAVDEPLPSNFESILKQIEQLSPEERNTLVSIAQSGKASVLNSPIDGVANRLVSVTTICLRIIIWLLFIILAEFSYLPIFLDGR